MARLGAYQFLNSSRCSDPRPMAAPGRVALDKSEGSVEQKLSLAMLGHRDVCRVTTKKSHR